MKKIINLILALSFMFSMLSCNIFPQPPPPANLPEVVAPEPPVVPAPVVVKPKPVIYVRSDHSFGFNDTAYKMLETGTHVVHVQYDRGYDILNLSTGEFQLGEWPASWMQQDKITVGIWDVKGGHYEVSIRIQ